MTETRKLAAILAADVVGYSRLAGADEDRTLARLRALRSDLIDATIAVHNGRVVKRTGDGILMEFRVIDAVRCAVEVQNGMIERNAGLPRAPWRGHPLPGQARRPPDNTPKQRHTLASCVEVRFRIKHGTLVETRTRHDRDQSARLAARPRLFVWIPIACLI
jgi:hypothetical protein